MDNRGNLLIGCMGVVVVLVASVLLCIMTGNKIKYLCIVNVRF